MTATRKRQRPASAPKPREPIEGGYRCAECGHGEKLWAYAGANAYGPLAADGSELAEHEAVEEWGIHEDSIQCTEHPGAVIEQFTKGRWCRWWSCARCGGGGVVRYGGGFGREYSSRCQEKTPFPARPVSGGDAGTVHEGWLPVEEHQTATGG